MRGHRHHNRLAERGKALAIAHRHRTAGCCAVRSPVVGKAKEWLHLDRVQLAHKRGCRAPVNKHDLARVYCMDSSVHVLAAGCAFDVATLAYAGGAVACMLASNGALDSTTASYGDGSVRAGASRTQKRSCSLVHITGVVHVGNWEHAWARALDEIREIRCYRIA